MAELRIPNLLKELQKVEPLVTVKAKKDDKTIIVDGHYDMEMIIKACIASFASKLENHGANDHGHGNVCPKE